LETGSGLQITPNSVLASASFNNLSRPIGQHSLTVTSVFATDDRPDQVCATLIRIASQIPERRTGADPTAIPIAPKQYLTTIPLRSPGDDIAAKATFLRWLWYAARRDGLHLDESADTFSDPDAVAEAIRQVVTPTLRLNVEEQHQMAESSTIQRFGSGELIQAAGTVPDGVSFIVSGTVVLAAETVGAGPTELSRLDEGSSFGHSSLVRHSVMDSAYALGEVTVVQVERDVIEEVVHRNPMLLEIFGRSIAERRAAVAKAQQDAVTAQSAART
jgi:hypothetical protein